MYFYVSKCSVDITATREHEMLFPLAFSDLFLRGLEFIFLCRKILFFFLKSG